MATVEKKVRAKERHQRAISRFMRWLELNPNAPLTRRVKKFDDYCDHEVKTK